MTPSPTTLDAFLDALLAVTADPARFRPEILRSPPEPTRGKTLIAVGVGAWPADDAAWPDYFLLNQKMGRDSRRFGDPPPRSVSELVADHADAAFRGVAGWSGRPLAGLGDEAGLQAFLADAVLVVEDASPDSVLSVLMLLARLAGVGPEEIPRPWVRAATRWETASTAASRDRGWAPLQMALIEFINLGTPGEVREAWRLGLQFTASALKRQEDPDGLSDEFLAGPGAPAVQRRRAARLRYEALVREATRWQMMLPMAGSGDAGRQRHRLADALVIYQSAPIGTLKEEARADAVHAPLGNGFEVLVYLNPREAEKGSGYAAAISVPNESHLDLADLWERMEAAETGKWEAGRPADAPRRIRLPRGKAPAWNQPWFPLLAEDGMERTVMVCSPDRLPDGKTGRRLSFGEIEEVLWQAGSPARFARVCAEKGGRSASLAELAPDHAWQKAADDETRSIAPGAAEAAPSRPPDPLAAKSPKSLFIAHYAKEDARDGIGPDDSATAFTSETLLRTIAARLEFPSRTPSFAEVKTRRRFERLPLTAGFAVVSPHGAWVYDDWSEDHFDEAELRCQFAHCVAAEKVLGHIGGRLDAIGNAVNDYVLGKKSGRPFGGLFAGQRLLRDLADCRNTLAQVSNLLARRGEDRDSEDFRAAVSRLWRLGERRDEAAGRIAAFEESIRSAEAARSKTAVEILANGGLVFGLTAVAYDPIRKLPELARAALNAKAELARCTALEKEAATAAAKPAPAPQAAVPPPSVQAPATAPPAGKAPAKKPPMAPPPAVPQEATLPTLAAAAVPPAAGSRSELPSDCEAIARMRMVVAEKGSPGPWLASWAESVAPAWDPFAATVAALVLAGSAVAILRRWLSGIGRKPS